MATGGIHLSAGAGARGQRLLAAGAADGGSIAIGALTELIFGKKEERSENLYGGLTPEGKQMLESLRPLRPVCIQEIV